jgi:hypothetical protein
MKDHRSITPLKRISLIFLTIGALSLTSSWLTSCSENVNAASDHLGIENRLSRIEAKQTKQGTDISELIDLTKFMAKEIGTMADRILEMADKIVETEVLIVQVITNQTDAATGTINKLTALKVDPSSTTPGDKLFINFDPTVTPYVLNSILKGDVAIKTPANIAVNANVPPAITAFGAKLLSNYILEASLDAKFATPVQSEITVASKGTGVPTDINVVWSNMVGANQLAVPANKNTKVYIAIRNLDVTTGVVSKLSNSVAFTFN